MNSLLMVFLLLAQPSLDQKAPSLKSNEGFNFKTYAKPKTRTIKRIIRKKIPLKIKVYTAKNLFVDLLVTCNKKNVMITYMRVDKKFCTPKRKCHKSLAKAVRPYC